MDQKSYQNDIIFGSLLPWIKKRFKKRPWTFQQDSDPAQGAKNTQELLFAKVPQLISKE